MLEVASPETISPLAVLCVSCSRLAVSVLVAPLSNPSLVIAASAFADVVDVAFEWLHDDRRHCWGRESVI
jgi:hypothetical protein